MNGFHNKLNRFTDRDAKRNLIALNRFSAVAINKVVVQKP